MTKLKREIVIVGGGLAGYSAAIALACEGFETALVAPALAVADGRSTALIGNSVSFLTELGIFGRLEAAQSLATMRIIDDTGRLFRSPQIEFRAGEIGLSAFGYNVLNRELLAALADRAEELRDRLTVIETPALDLAVEGEEARVTLGDGTVVAALLAVAADGRNSMLRDKSGIGVREWSYPQTALVLNFDHELAHHDISTEFHTRTGPFTQVPLPGRRSSLVWVEQPETAELYVDLKKERLEEIVERKLHSILGKVTIDGAVQAFALKGAVAHRMTGNRLALVGEAAHVFPPIGAQGLNLGLRDAAALAKTVRASRDDPGRWSALARYEADRKGDVLSRTFGVDVLNRSLLGGYLPIQMARSLGLAALSGFAPLRRFAMREGTSPGAGLFGLPEMLRGGFGRTGPGN